MTENEKQDILEKAKEFFKDIIVKNHIKNTKKLVKLKKFNVNPFLITYLANYLTGNNSAKSIAKALIYPRVLGTSINTSFGNKLQLFCSRVLSGFASTTSGIDIEFIDAVDNRRKYCQIKAGPNTINKDDVETIKNHFMGIRKLARTNGLSIQFDDLVLGVLYGTEKELNGNYKKVNEDYPVIVGRDFWYHITGDKDFYLDLISTFGEVAIEADSTKLLKETIDTLACEVENSDEFKNLLKKDL